jgi:hypothetical protein
MLAFSSAAFAADKVKVVSALSFIPPYPEESLVKVEGGPDLRSTVYPFHQGNEQLFAPVELPDGAIVTGIALTYHILTEARVGAFEMSIEHFCEADHLPCNNDMRPQDGVLTPVNRPPGEYRVTNMFSEPRAPVDNANETYYLELRSSNWDRSMAFGSARIYYRLSAGRARPVSPTFSDVPPESAYFPFVEALAAAGVTGGCGGGNFCPTAFVTREQLAVMLASAVGIYYPN